MDQSQMQDNGYMLVEKPPSTFVDQTCMRRCCTWFGLTFVALLVFAVIATATGPAGLVCMAVAPSVILLTLVEKFFRRSVTQCQMAVTFMEAVLWMVPLMIWITLYGAYLEGPLGLKDKGVCAKCVASYMFNAFVMAGFFEEMLKFLAVRRLEGQSFVVCPRSLMVYGICSGCGFATVENIMYVLSSGAGTAFVRAFLSVPLHCSTGAIIGLSLAHRKFHNANIPLWQIMAVPIFAHGMFDFVLFLGEGSGTMAGAICANVFSILVFIGTVSYARYLSLQIFEKHPVRNVHDLIEDGEVEVPCQTCEPFCCTTCMR